MKYKILIVDDHWVVREGLKLVLETNDSYEVIGEAGEGTTALKLIEELQPDVILLDLYMPQMSGLETMKALREKQNETPVIILTTYNEDDLMIKGLSLGAKGYLLKDTSRENLFRTIESALRGETLLQPEITARVFAATNKKEAKPEQHESSLVLTDKERHILKSVAHGFKSKEIAFDMGISERTVKAHLTNIYNKLGVDSRSEAVAVSLERGILQL
ncbi:response regulator [Paenibacillus polymyxa]|uniref:response regulator n=1 Tax=Paenibacillus polymyxa TaxID=1406 RepID=UPI002023C707|nr:response regulator transcription factor [Paenibacillus polymyxa]MDP9678261.1 NarL family two-component system response regulator YdfI [Paenibacillus jamilae]MDU8673121.1 response regulator transcription factor [Paenibacillus polymyxa]MDU8698028.1 response regulator transcription factor [Paenibacillus polymyxa]URJ57171.1 response regulator transcription factor [Paenibacillus polymyxa]URJ64593.1 response regulator transcription factor [Paenibacillus polymyxa]